MGGERRPEVPQEASETIRIGGGVVFGSNKLCRKLMQHKQRFVGQPRTANNSHRISSMFIRNFIQPLRNVTDSFIPGCGNQFAAFFVTDHWRANTRFVVNERMTKAAFDTKEFAVDAVHVTIARD